MNADEFEFAVEALAGRGSAAQGICARVVATGAAAAGLHGRQVAIPRALGCGECGVCRRAEPSVCPSRSFSEESGGFARARWTCFVPEGMPASRAAIAAGPALLAYSLFARIGTGPGDRVSIAGGGPLEELLRRLAVARGARLDIDPMEEPVKLFVLGTSRELPLIAAGSTVACAVPMPELLNQGACDQHLTVAFVRWGQPDLLTEVLAMIDKEELVVDDLIEIAPFAASDFEEKAAEAAQRGRILVATP